MSTRRLGCLNLLLLLCAFLFAAQTHAMNMPHYDVSSLVYMSTDIVIANISQDQQHKFTATVTQTLYGKLQPSDQITGLDPFLMFFKPVEDGMKVVLFLDRRPRSYDFLNSEAAKAPFAIPPSGVYLIDTYGHVHQYYQMSNPGPYEAQGYSDFIKPRVPTREESLALPSIEETTNGIATAIKAVEPIRSLLERIPARNDVPALLHLRDLTSNNATDCSLRLANAISDRAFERLLSLDDPDVALRAYAVRGNNDFVIEGFANPERVRYLVKVLLDRKEDLTLRVTAVEILLRLSRFHSTAKATIGPSRPLPLDNDWVKDSAEGIQTASGNIFADASENPRLRALCLQFLSFDDSDTAAAIKRVYHSTQSEELRFAIEDAFLEESDALYQSLASSTGRVTSIVYSTAKCPCTRTFHTDAAFNMKYREPKSLGTQRGYINSQYLLTNLKTGQKVEIALERIHVLSWGVSSDFTGWAQFELRDLPNMPDGEYSIALQRVLDGKPLPPGHSVKFKIRKTSKGTEVLMEDPKTS